MIRDSARLAARTFDLLVVGGGIYGLTVAADAAQRGLSVALIDRGDFGAATSFNHLRTIHGGLRYLQTLDLARARESIRERRTLARIAPAKIRVMPFVLPLTSRVVRGPAMMRAAFLLDRLVSHDRNDGVPDDLRLRSGSVLTPGAATDRFPRLSGQRLAGAAVWWDYVTTESDRLTFSWAAAAAGHGAALANYVDATALSVDGRRVIGAHAVDRLRNTPLDIAARLVVNATGAELDTLLTPAGAATRTPMLKAMNLVTRLPAGDAAIGGISPSGRSLFMVPWRGRAIFGTWESREACAADAVSPAGAEIDTFVDELTVAFPAFGLTRSDVTLVHRGVVPAVADGNGGVRLEGRQQVRDHAADAQPLEGLMSVAGTKYTTARVVAEEIVDRVMIKLKRPATACRTATTPLPGTSPLAATPPPPAAAPRPQPPDVQAHLVAAYGPWHTAVLGLAGARPNLGDRISDALPVIGAELVWAARHEMAVTLTDAVVRRTPLGALGHPGEEAAARAAKVLAAELEWSAERVETELAALSAFYRVG